MEIIKHSIYRDGGTIGVSTKNGEFCIDDRIGSSTKGMIYVGYPNTDGTNPVVNQDSMRKEIIKYFENGDDSDITNAVKDLFALKSSKVEKYSDEFISERLGEMIYIFGEINFNIIKSEAWETYINESKPFDESQIKEMRDFLTMVDESMNEAKCDIPKEQWGVHITHCCNEHGCKYGDKGCPVELGLAKAKYLCEDCLDDINNV